MFALTMEHIMTAFDCTTNEALNRTTLDIDPTIECEQPKHMEIQYWAVGGFLAYIWFFGLKGYNLFKQLSALRQMPFWVDPYNCQRIVAKETNTPCFDCVVCDQRQRYHWIFSKYQPNLHLWEFAVLSQKLCYAAIALFLTTQESLALRSLIVLNTFMIAVVAYFQPYLTDEEYMKVARLGNAKANIKRQKHCSRDGFGVNNSLDIVLLLAETSLCISALITHDLMKPLEDQINSNLYSEGIDTINVTNGTTTIKTLLFQNANNYSVSALIAETYPVEDAVAGLFEWFGLAIFLSGYMYFVIIALLEIFNDGTKKNIAQNKHGETLQQIHRHLTVK